MIANLLPSRVASGLLSSRQMGKIPQPGRRECLTLGRYIGEPPLQSPQRWARPLALPISCRLYPSVTYRIGHSVTFLLCRRVIGLVPQSGVVAEAKLRPKPWAAS
jgi:hypothetical protein